MVFCISEQPEPHLSLPLMLFTFFCKVRQIILIGLVHLGSSTPPPADIFLYKRRCYGVFYVSSQYESRRTLSDTEREGRAGGREGDEHAARLRLPVDTHLRQDEGVYRSHHAEAFLGILGRRAPQEALSQHAQRPGTVCRICQHRGLRREPRGRLHGGERLPHQRQPTGGFAGEEHAHRTAVVSRPLRDGRLPRDGDVQGGGEREQQAERWRHLHGEPDYRWRATDTALLGA